MALNNFVNSMVPAVSSSIKYASKSSNAANTPVGQDYLYKGSTQRLQSMIDNYVYFYHTDTLIALPIYPESIADNMSVTYNPTSPLSSTAPTYSYQNSGPRSFDISLPLHRDLMSSINATNSALKNKIPELVQTDNQGNTITNVDYVDILVNQIYGAALPKFSDAEKMVNPPVVAVRFGNDIFCKGVIASGVSVTYAAPILSDGKYANITIAFTINEITPFDADTAMRMGGYRGYDLSGKI